MLKKIFFLLSTVLFFHTVFGQINYYDVPEFCLFCYEGSNANDTLQDGNLQESYFFIFDDDKNGDPDNEDFNKYTKYPLNIVW